MDLPEPDNLAFIEAHAAPGRIGLVGGVDRLGRAIRRLQNGLSRSAPRSLWTHAFLCAGRRIDGRHWVLESDIDIHRKHIRLGVQENRAEAYADAGEFPNIAFLDFGLSEEQVRVVLTEGLDLLAGRTRYSLRELVGTLFAVARPQLRERANLLSREGSLYCSAMVQHCYAAAGISLAGKVAVKNTMPEDLYRTALPHQRWELIRDRRKSGAVATRAGGTVPIVPYERDS